jgi:hypothetical protein
MSCRFRVSPLVALALLVPAFGCGSGGSYKTAPVSGRVTLDDKPLANAEVRFHPTAKDIVTPGPNQTAPYSHAETDADGKFTLKTFLYDHDVDGGIIGENKVTISLNERNMDKVGPRGMPRELVPAEYNTETTLKVTIPPEGKTENLELKSKKRK